MTDLPLHEAIARRALASVSTPPEGGDPVVRLASPEELAEVFAASVGLDLADGVAHSDEALMAAVEDVLRYSVRTSHPRFMNQNFAGPDPVAVVGDWLGSALNTTNATFEVAPVFTMMERAVLRRLAGLIGYQAGAADLTSGPAAGLFCAGGSLAGLIALQLARHRADPSVVRVGTTGTSPPAVFVSASGHYSAAKNAAMLGMGAEAVVEVATDAWGRMSVEGLSAEMEAARRRGRVPLAVIATAGTTVTAAFDPIEAIADVCEAEGLWLHVDACYGGSALFSPEQRHRLAGAERADSLVWNLHKMMGMTQQCTALLVRRPEQLHECFATGADYLFQADKQHGDLDAGDATIMCGRRVDVLKLWLAWKHHGDTGFAGRVDHAVALADHARRRIAAGDGSLAAVVAGDFTNVCFTWLPPQARESVVGPDGVVGELDPVVLDPAVRARLHDLAPRVKAAMQRDGSALLGYQPVRGINCFRLIVMNPAVSVADVDAVLDLVATHSAALW